MQDLQQRFPDASSDPQKNGCPHSDPKKTGNAVLFVKKQKKKGIFYWDPGGSRNTVSAVFPNLDDTYSGKPQKQYTDGTGMAKEKRIARRNTKEQNQLF